MRAPLPANEAARLAELCTFGILDTEPEKAFDDITRLVAQLYEVPICIVTLVDAARQWFKSSVGLDITETSRDVSFCAYTILDPTSVTVVADTTTDNRFIENPFVTGPASVRFYAGAPLITKTGAVLGSLCIIDRKPRHLTSAQEALLQTLAGQVVAQLELRRTIAEQAIVSARLRRSESLLAQAQRVAGVGSWEYNVKTGEITWSEGTYRLYGIDPSMPVPKFEAVMALHHPEDEKLLRQLAEEAFTNGTPYQTDLRILRTGDTMYVQANGEVVFGRDGEPEFLVGTVIDITERKLGEIAFQESAKRTQGLLHDVQAAASEAQEMGRMLRHAAQRFEGLFSGLPVACMTLDTTGVVMEWNAMSETVYGYSAAEALYVPIFDLLLREEHREAARLKFAKTIADARFRETVEMRAIRKDGKPIWVLTSSLPLHNPSGAFVGIISTNVDITDRKLAERQLKRSHKLIEGQRKELEAANARLESLAATDGLTGLNNHRAFHDTLKSAVSHASRAGSGLSTIILDVDDFKAFNDEFGHPEGDAVLKRVADIIKESARSDDFVARYGGEEYSLVLPGQGIVESAVIAERIRAAIESADWPLRRITVSIGVSTLSETVCSRDDLMRSADEALYYSKRHGRNRVTHADLPALLAA